RRAGFWWASWSAVAMGLLCNRNLLFDLVVVVGFPGDDRLLFEIERWRRRGDHPLEAGRVPGIVRSRLAVAHRPQEINHGQHVTDGEDSRARGRKHIQDLEFRGMGVVPVAARHPHVAQNELREEGEVEAYETEQGGKPPPTLGIHASGDFRPPEMHAAQ